MTQLKSDKGNRGERIIMLMAVFLVLFLFSFSAYSMPYHPDLIAKAKRGEIVLEDLSVMSANGYNVPSGKTPVKNFLQNKALMAPGLVGATGDFKMLVILVEFPDQTHVVNPDFFDELIFSTGTHLDPSIRHYYSDQSGGLLNMITDNSPTSIGWVMAPENYSYYVNSQYGAGPYPNNAQKLVEDVIAIVDSQVDFSVYDNDGDNEVDGIAVIHTGPGREFTGSNNDIHSHMYYITPQIRDGVTISQYSIQPEYWSFSIPMTIGVMAHESGHLFGLPDLYDTDGTSAGIGEWSIMAAGSWNGPSGKPGGSPASFDPWCKKELGFKVPENVSADTLGIELQDVNSAGNIFRLNTNNSQQYFLIENRQKTGYDTYNPGDGLLIWHINEANLYKIGSNTANNDEYNYLVNLEQADGEFDLEERANQGDENDPFKGPTDFVFGQGTDPNSNLITSGNSGVAIANISESGDIMTVDVYIGEPYDSSAPVRSNGNPSGTVPAGTTEVMVSLTTDDNAHCRYSANPGVNFLDMTGIFEDTGFTDHSFEETGLSNGDTGTFYVRCMNVQGYMNNDDYVIEFEVEETPEDMIKPDAIDDLTVVECDRDTCRIAWTATGDDNLSGKAFRYDIRYSKEEITDENWSDAIQVEDEPDPLEAGSDEEMYIEGLDELTKYYFAIRVSDEHFNWSDRSNLAEGETTDKENVTLTQNISGELTVTGGCGLINKNSESYSLILLSLLLISGIYFRRDK